MKLRQLPSGSWTTQVQIDGHRRSITAKSKEEVKKRAMQYAVTGSYAPSVPLGTLIDNYIDTKRNLLSPSTVERYERIRRRHFQNIMNIRADRMTSERIQSEINLMAVKYSPKTIRNAYSLITATLDLYAPHVKFKVTMPAKVKTEYHIPTTEDVNALIAHASPNMKTAIMLAAFCGLRRGEIAALTASDILSDALCVRRSAVYDSDGKMVIKHPKTYHSARIVMMPDIVREHIKDKTDRICPLALSTITREFDALRDRLGMRCRFHDLRHYYASVLHAIGIPDQYIMQSGGWKSDFMLKAVYRNTLDDFRAQNDAKINAYFSKNANNIPQKVQTKCKRKPRGDPQDRIKSTASHAVIRGSIPLGVTNRKSREST